MMEPQSSPRSFKDRKNKSSLERYITTFVAVNVQLLQGEAYHLVKGESHMAHSTVEGFRFGWLDRRIQSQVTGKSEDSRKSKERTDVKLVTNSDQIPAKTR